LAPVTHVAGLLAACIVPLVCGAGAVILPRWNVERAVDAIDRHRVTWSLGAAVLLKELVEEIPTEWHFVPEIPTTSSGKVQKHLLRARRDTITVQLTSASSRATNGGKDD
jgi:acyl-coenzyme A synthetase/AMP-(fatty) acid ligase